jgi:hypothetical protein
MAGKTHRVVGCMVRERNRGLGRELVVGDGKK